MQAVVVGSTAITSLPGASSRRGEVSAVREVLTASPLIKSMAELQPPATLDGGDVMLAGGILWVGITRRTNLEAVHQMTAILSPLGIPVVGLPVKDDGSTLHLKSLMSAFDGTRIIVADVAAGRSVEV